MGFGALALLAVTTVVWVTQLHRFVPRSPEQWQRPGQLAPLARALLEQQLHLWSDPRVRRRELEEMRVSNPEWAFMFRTYLVLALANVGLQDAGQQPAALGVIDGILDETLSREQELGFQAFLLGYGQGQEGWIQRPPRSLFVDGEIALMLAARLFLEPDETRRVQLAERVQRVVQRMEAGPVLSAESYPDECWVFCNTVALAAVRMSDVLLGEDHGALLRQWVTTARAKLVEPETGLLISAYDLEGHPAECGRGGEGSSIWMAAHMLQLVDEEFAREQYRRARQELARSFLGFGYSREWPESARTSPDIDSGPVVPGLEASASASGLALLGAAAFGDEEFFHGLLRSLDLAAFPDLDAAGRLRLLASNPVGDAVVLYALVQGPLWQAVRRRSS